MKFYVLCTVSIWLSGCSNCESARSGSTSPVPDDFPNRTQRSLPVVGIGEPPMEAVMAPPIHTSTVVVAVPEPKYPKDLDPRLARGFFDPPVTVTSTPSKHPAASHDPGYRPDKYFNRRD